MVITLALIIGCSCFCERQADRFAQNLVRNSFTGIQMTARQPTDSDDAYSATAYPQIQVNCKK
jgi:hypothetical protein